MDTIFLKVILKNTYNNEIDIFKYKFRTNDEKFIPIIVLKSKILDSENQIY